MQGRFRAAMARGWAVGDACIFWSPDESAHEGVRFWRSCVREHVPESTSWRGSPWARLRVDHESKEDETVRKSAWELFEPVPNPHFAARGTASEAAPRWVPQPEAHMALTQELTEMLGDALEALSELPDSALLLEPTPPELAVGRTFYGSAVPLPLGLATLQARLDSGYYRQPEAFRHDVLTLQQNAVSVDNGEGGPVVAVAAKTVDALLALLPPPPPLPALRLEGLSLLLLPRAPGGDTGGAPHASQVTTQLLAHAAVAAAQQQQQQQQAWRTDDTSGGACRASPDGRGDGGAVAASCAAVVLPPDAGAEGMAPEAAPAAAAASVAVASVVVPGSDRRHSLRYAAVRATAAHAAVAAGCVDDDEALAEGMRRSLKDKGGGGGGGGSTNIASTAEARRERERERERKRRRVAGAVSDGATLAAGDEQRSVLDPASLRAAVPDSGAHDGEGHIRRAGAGASDGQGGDSYLGGGGGPAANGDTHNVRAHQLGISDTASLLPAAFKLNPFPDHATMTALAAQEGSTPELVSFWFKFARARGVLL